MLVVPDSCPRGLFARLERIPKRKDKADGFLRSRDIGATIREDKSLNRRLELFN